MATAGDASYWDAFKVSMISCSSKIELARGDNSMRGVEEVGVVVCALDVMIQGGDESLLEDVELELSARVEDTETS